jgi:hypothetical protein
VARARRPPTVERKVYFYRVEAGLDDAGRPLPFDPRPALTHISGLPFTPGGRYWEQEESVTCCTVDRLEGRERLRLINVRRSGLPQVEDGGEFTPLALPLTSGLAEPIHIVHFGDNIIGAEFNFYGPRATRLAGYLAEKAAAFPPRVALQPLLRHDVADQLAALQDIRLFDLKISAAYTDTIEEADRDLASAFKAAGRAGDAEELQIILRPRAYSRGTLSGRLLAAAKRLVRRNDLRESSSHFVVRGLSETTGRVEPIDVLRDQLISVKQIVRQDGRSRAVDSHSAYEAVEAAYGELEEQIRGAAALR